MLSLWLSSAMSSFKLQVHNLNVNLLNMNYNALWKLTLKTYCEYYKGVKKR